MRVPTSAFHHSPDKNGLAISLERKPAHVTNLLAGINVPLKAAGLAESLAMQLGNL